MNQSRSRIGTIRGLHYRRDSNQWKQIRVARGALYDVIVDLRPRSSTYLEIATFELSDSKMTQIIIPPGCLHGFQALYDEVDVVFNASVHTNSSLDAGVRFDDETLSIDWPMAPSMVSGGDACLPELLEIEAQFVTDFANLAPGSRAINNSDRP